MGIYSISNNKKWQKSVLTSHAIVGKPLTELIYNNEEDADWVAKQHFTLID